jgi:predicted RNase H-like HicB family nuclease
MSERRYLIIIEGDGEINYSAYCPDIPGVVATGRTQLDCTREMREAVAFHLEGLAQDDEPLPGPRQHGELRRRRAGLSVDVGWQSGARAARQLSRGRLPGADVYSNIEGRRGWRRHKHSHPSVLVL